MIDIERFIDLLKKEELVDILNVGYIDNDETINRFVPMLNTILLEFETKYVRIYRKQSTAFNLELTLLDKKEIINESLSHDVYKEYEFCLSSLSSMFIYEERGSTNFVETLECYVESDLHYKNGVIKCLGIELKNDTYIFFNPLNFNSIEIGKRSERDDWFEYVPYMDQGVVLSYSPKELKYKKIELD